MYSAAEAATVKRVLRKKSVVIIDEGKSSGIQKKAKVCFFNGDGEEITCGRVRRVKKSVSYVRVKKKFIKKIRKGFSAEVEGGGGGSSSSSGSMLAIRGFLGGSYLLPASATAPAYAASTASSGGPFWESGTERGTGVMVGGEVEYVPLSIAAGFRYFVMSPVWKVEMDYSDTATEYVYLEQSQSSMGFWADYLYPLNMGGMTLNVGGGLDIEMSTVRFEALQMTDGSDESANLAQGTSSVTAIGLRVPVRLDVPMGGIILNVGGALVIGLSGTPAISFASESEDPNATDLAKYEEEFAAALAHGAGFGVMGSIGIQMNL